ncbi:MAG: hypothetical protein KJZ65_11770 [Phycisphaerales bacterium]|nr:hypothetical protein [Phycisphaerales bacterium]
MKRLISMTIAAVAPVATAQPIETRAQLEAVLGDALVLEDFEGFSIHGGTSVAAPNPLNSATQPAGWGIMPGVTYSSPHWLRVYASFVWGDDSNVLAGGDDLLIAFDQPQQAVGLDVVSITGNVMYHDVVTFSHGEDVLGTVELDLLPGGEAFVGWRHPAGITHVRVRETATAGWAIIDNVAWGLMADLCLADMNSDGLLDFFDVQAFLAALADHDPAADFNGDDVFDFFDVQAFLAAFAFGCP